MKVDYLSKLLWDLMGLGKSFDDFSIFSCLFTILHFFSSYSQYGGASMSSDMRNMIYGGIRIITIMDDDENAIFEEKSSHYRSVRPHFLMNGQETKERLRRICSWIDAEIDESRLLFADHEKKQFRLYCQFSPSWDGKVSG